MSIKQFAKIVKEEDVDENEKDSLLFVICYLLYLNDSKYKEIVSSICRPRFLHSS
jgi:hypothetical protein